MDRLKALEALKAVVDHSGFTRGAEAMNMCKSATTRLIQELETEMGVRLLIRTTRKVSLTPVGRCVYERASALLGSYEELAFMCKENVAEPSGLVRLEVPAIYGAHRLGVVLGSFVREYPKINVDLHIADSGSEVLSEGADVAISVGRCIPSSLVARQLTPLKTGLYASKQYIRSTSEITHPSQLLLANLMVHSDLTGGRPLELFNETTGASFSVAQNSSLRANHADTLVGAAIHGTGIALVPCDSVTAAQANGTLFPVLASWWPKPIDVQLVYRAPRFQPVRLRKLIEHLLQNMAKLDRRVEPARTDSGIRGTPMLTRQQADRELMVA
jgi:DNA-binding transcriptional LysR family regulator